MSTLHDRAKELFLAALAVPAAERDAFLTGGCGRDAALRQEVESLLAFHEEEEPEAEVASGPPARGSGGEAFAPGEVFASRYRMVTRLGRGGMGDVWRADDLVLGIPVALKLIRFTSPDARARIVNEVRLARQITHPGVCRVFDVGEADDQVFLSMELIRGEDLASLLKRVGRLPSEKVIEIGHHLCAGLAAAHARGVLHRDLKPANVLIDENGRTLITDFGIAVTTTAVADHTPGGTPGYMAPEQFTGGPLSEQTDVYALGLVLYELVVGHRHGVRPGPASQPPAPSTLAPDVNPQLERVILKALSVEPRDRPASALAMAADLPALDTRDASGVARAAVAGHRRRARPWIAGIALAALVAAVAVGLPFFFERGASALTGQDTIVLADFMNTTGEPVFDGALKVALAVALEQSPFLKVFPDERVRETLRLMKRSPDARITAPIAREIAQREQLKALLTGSIATLGRNYVIALEAVNAQTGDVMAREQVEVASKEQVLTGLGTAASSLRGKLGESLSSIQKFDVPLPKATTPSLDALHAYALALDEGRLSVRLDAIPHLRRAIEIDPDFALAQAQLSGVYANTGQTELAPVLSRRAFELRDRVSERERFFVSWRYYRDALQAWDKGLELARAWTAAYPREPQAFNSLGLAYSSLGQHAPAIEAFREALRLDPRFLIPYANLASTLAAANRFQEAKEAIQQAAAKHLDSVGLHQTAFGLAAIDDDSAVMARELKLALDDPEAIRAFDWEAHLSAFAGRSRMAHEQFHQALQMPRVGEFKEWAARFTLHDAESHAVVGQCRETREEVAAGLGFSRDSAALDGASRSLALCGDGREASELSDELAKRFPEATLVFRVSLPVSAAALAIHSGQAARALELLNAIAPYDHAPAARLWPAYLRGQAYLQLKQGREADVQFQSVLDHRGEAPTSPLYPLAHLGQARGAALGGDLEKARQAYNDFFAAWKTADPDLQPLKEAREEYARLR